jgi:hydroxypyruvate isomerase
MTAGYAVNCSILLTDLPLLQRPAAARAAGFEAVEFWWPFADAVPPAADVEAFADAIEEAGVRLVGLNFFAGDMPGGDRGVASWPGREQEFRENVELAVELGARLGVPAFNALYGNRVEGADPFAQDELAQQNLAVAAAAAARINATVLVEPLSGAARYPLTTAAHVRDVLDQLAASGVDNAAMLADLYHLAVNGEDVGRAIADQRNVIAHVQIADAPGRGAPGSGELPLLEWLADLRAGGYDGYVGLEYAAAGDPAPFAWLASDGEVTD